MIDLYDLVILIKFVDLCDNGYNNFIIIIIKKF